MASFYIIICVSSPTLSSDQNDSLHRRDRLHRHDRQARQSHHYHHTTGTPQPHPLDPEGLRHAQAGSPEPAPRIARRYGDCC